MGANLFMEKLRIRRRLRESQCLVCVCVCVCVRHFRASDKTVFLSIVLKCRQSCGGLATSLSFQMYQLFIFYAFCGNWQGWAQKLPQTHAHISSPHTIRQHNTLCTIINTSINMQIPRVPFSLFFLCVFKLQIRISAR